MIEQAQKLLTQLGDLSPAMLCLLVLLAINLGLRRIPFIPNWSIFIFSMAAGMFLFPVFLPLATHFKNPIGRNICIGLIVGVGAYVGYGGLMRYLGRKHPQIYDFINGPMENTQVLLIENEPMDVELMLYKLRNVDVETHVAKSGQDAIRMLEAGHYHFILLDLKLNGVSGLDVQRHCIERGIKTPIIVLTGMDPNSADVAEARRLGALWVVSKDTVTDRDLKKIFNSDTTPQI